MFGAHWILHHLCKNLEKILNHKYIDTLAIFFLRIFYMLFPPTKTISLYTSSTAVMVMCSIYQVNKNIQRHLFLLKKTNKI